MRVMQLIDSLNVGGAERMAVTYANALSHETDKSYLCVTRTEGPLQSQLASEVSYIFLDRKKRIDITAVKKCITYLKKENIDIIHVHGTSYFFATLVKLGFPKIKLVWHNHHGASKLYSGLKLWLLQWCSRSFNAVFTVNKELEGWASEKLYCKKVLYIQNFLSFRESKSEHVQVLQGVREHRVISLANLRHPKEHLFLCKTFKEVVKEVPTATLHLVGSDYEDAYSNALRDFVQNEKLEQSIYFHGKQDAPQNFLNASSIGVIASSSEGLPMALLEYGRAGLAVITTAVGECAEVVSSHGAVIPSGDLESLKDALVEMLTDKEKRDTLAKQYQAHIQSNYSETQVLYTIQSIYREL